MLRALHRKRALNAAPHTPPSPLSLVRTDISSPSSPEAWEDVIPEDPKDLLQWAQAAKVKNRGGRGRAAK